MLDVLETAPDGSLLVGGLLQGTLKADDKELLTPGDKKAYTVTLSKEGKPLGAKLSAGEGSHRLVSAAFDTKNNRYLLFSISGNFGFGSDSIVTVPTSMKSGLVLHKTGEPGNLVWMKTFESSDYIEGTKVLVGSGGEITVCANYNKTLKTGDSLYSTPAQLETMLFTYNSSGELQWGKRITSPVKSRAMGVLYTRTGNLLLSGYFRQSYPPLAQVCDLCLALKKQKNNFPCETRYGLHPDASGPRQQQKNRTSTQKNRPSA